MEQRPSTYVFHVSGMHCKACTILIEESLKDMPFIESAQVSLPTQQVTITGTFSGEPRDLADELSTAVRGHGYAITIEKIAQARKWEDFYYAVPIALLLIAAFFVLQKAGLASLITSSNVSFGTAFIIGLIASVSSCLAIVGGLVLSLSANSAKEGGTWRTQSLFHVGRIGGFFLLGGLVGLIGNALQLGLMANIVLSGLVAVVMLILGINLLDVFHVTKKLQLTMPAAFSRRILRRGPHDHYLAPVLIGIGTFFLPCGFTQSMQLHALSTGSFTQGSLTMLFFALGTFPMLALLSFGTLNIAHRPWKGIFFKTAGIVVILLALLNLSNVFATIGVIAPLFNI